MNNLEDSKIIALFNERSQNAITELSEKYGKLCLRIAKNILANDEDATECLNDTLLAVWNAIPPESPDPLCAFVAAVARNQALKKYNSSRALRRNSSLDISLDELENLFAADSSPENELFKKELAAGINRFLAEQKADNRVFFIRRYFFGDSVKDIAELSGTSPHFVAVRLQRTREALKKYLEKEGLI